jgi:Fe-S-cluster containining protein
MQVFRIGECNNCGECCLDAAVGYKPCPHYNPHTQKHCMIYTCRPLKCRIYPSTPADLAIRLNCGYQFVDEKGNVVDCKDDPEYTRRLKRIIANRASV